MKPDHEEQPDILLAAHYEELRRQVLDESGGAQRSLGWTLFIRCGMAEWMRRWSQVAKPAERRAGEATEKANEESGLKASILPSWNREIILLLANMTSCHLGKSIRCAQPSFSSGGLR